MSKRAPSLLCMLGVWLLAGLSRGTYVNVTVEEFVGMSRNSTNAVYIFVDSRYNQSRRYIQEGLDKTAEMLTRGYPSLTVYLVDRRNRGGSQGDVLYEKFVIYEYPSANLIMSSVRIPIPGSMQPEKVLERVARRLGNYPMEISTIHGVGKLNPEKLVIMYHSTDPKFNYLMKGFACRFIKPLFVQLQSAELVTRVGESYGYPLQPWNSTVVLAKYPMSNMLRQMAQPDAYSLLKLIQFISIVSKPPANFYTPNSIGDIQDFRKAVVIYACDPNTQQREIDTITQAVERQYKIAKSLFIEQSNPQGAAFLSSIGFPVSFPRLYLIKKRYDGRFDRYVFKQKDGFSLQTVEEFIQDAADSLLPKYYMTEAVPGGEELYPGVKTLVGATLSAQVFQGEDLYHVVFIYDRLTAGALPAFQKLAQRLQHEKIRFYILNAEKNDHPRLRAAHEGRVLVYSKTEGLQKTFRVDLVTLSLAGIGPFLQKHLKTDPSVASLVGKTDIFQDL